MQSVQTHDAIRVSNIEICYSVNNVGWQAKDSYNCRESSTKTNIRRASTTIPDSAGPSARSARDRRSTSGEHLRDKQRQQSSCTYQYGKENGQVVNYHSSKLSWQLLPPEQSCTRCTSDVNAPAGLWAGQYHKFLHPMDSTSVLHQNLGQAK